MNTRFARFQNVPEMLRMWHVFADVKTAEDLRLPVPTLKPHVDHDGHQKHGPHTVVIPAGPEITDYLHELAARAEAVRSRAVAPEEDNMLKISTDGRKAALDMRLVTRQRTAGECKLERAATTIAGIWRETRALTYTDPDSGEPSPIPGALQIVFCDLSTPTDAWNAYTELRALLAEHGIPEHQVRFIHEARNDAEKARLFASCRNGHVAVLIGSTEKMGVGTNIQTRAIALHHLDCPWRPADIEQREGRILRQGNHNPEVEIHRYVVERSFDAYSWQTVERKAKFINQITRGRLDVREVDDVGDSALSYTEVKALASGDPLILEHPRASNNLTRLERLQRAHGHNQQNLRYALTSATEREHARGRETEQIDAAIARRTDSRADHFQFTVGAVTHTERRAAADALARWAETAPTGTARPRGTLGGLQVTGMVRIDHTQSGREAVATPQRSAVRARARLAQAPPGEPARAHPPTRAPHPRPRHPPSPNDRQTTAGRTGDRPCARRAQAAVQTRQGPPTSPLRARGDHRTDEDRRRPDARGRRHLTAGRNIDRPHEPPPAAPPRSAPHVARARRHRPRDGQKTPTRALTPRATATRPPPSGATAPARARDGTVNATTNGA